MSELRLLDLFSGIGGFSLGLERTGGFRAVAFCEISAPCRHLLAHHWPDVPCYEDITTLTAERLATDGIEVDAICGGFPCQDLSFAGKGAGITGARSGLWSEYARLIGELRPRVVFVENVPALLSRGMGVVLGDLAALGYDAWWDCIPASAVGAPHRRDRLWIVAYARGQQHEGCGAAIGREAAALLARPDAASERFTEARQLRCDEPTQRTAGICEAVADRAMWERNDVAIARPGQDQGRLTLRGRIGVSWRDWATEPSVGRVAHGVPARVDRLHGLGNAVVPEIPYRIGQAVLSALKPLAEAA